MSTDPKVTQRVGYGHPPTHSQFRPGESGNPSGRPKRRRSFQNDLRAALDASMPTDADKTKQQAIIDRLVAAALAGDTFAIKTVIPLATSEPEQASDGELTAEQSQLIEDFNRRQESAESEPHQSLGGHHAPEVP